MARAPGSPPRGGSVWSTARSARRPAPRPPLLPSLHSKRMNQPRPGAQPPRFLFSFSTPPAAGAARLHRRGFPGTLPLAPRTALGAARLLLGSLTPRSPGATARQGPPPPHRLAAASPRAAPRRSLRSPAGEARALECVSVLLPGAGARGAAENPAWSARRRLARRPGSRPPRGSGGTWGARARDGAPAPRGPRTPSRAEALPVAQTAQIGRASCRERVSSPV